MDKLIITVTCDSTMSFPRNPHNPTPKGISEVAKEYVRSVEARGGDLPSPRPLHR